MPPRCKSAPTRMSKSIPLARPMATHLNVGVKETENVLNVSCALAVVCRLYSCPSPSSKSFYATLPPLARFTAGRALRSGQQRTARIGAGIEVGPLDLVWGRPSRRPPNSLQPRHLHPLLLDRDGARATNLELLVGLGGSCCQRRLHTRLTEGRHVGRRF